jgi:hypothetical protein
MAKMKEKKYSSTREWLLAKVEEFLVNNPHLDPESFGWKSVRDTSIVSRLRVGKDVTTRKLDMLIAYMANPNQPR